MQGSCSHAQHFTCPAYHKNLFTEASIVYRAKKTLKEALTSPCSNPGLSGDYCKISSYTSAPTVPVFLIYKLAFSFGSLQLRITQTYFLTRNRLKESINIWDNGFKPNRVRKYKGTSLEFVLLCVEMKRQQCSLQFIIYESFLSSSQLP